MRFTFIVFFFASSFHAILAQVSKDEIVKAEFVTITRPSIPLFSEPNDPDPIVLKNQFGVTYEYLRRAGSYARIRVPNYGEKFIERKAGDWLKSRSKSGVTLAKVSEKSGKIIQKALVINNLRLDPKAEIEINYYADPELKKKIGKISIFEVRYIFEEVDTSGKSAILVGRSDRFGRSNAANVLVGWMDKQHIVKWETLLGLEFDKKNYLKRKSCGRGRIFDSVRALTGGQEPIFYEGSSPEPMVYYANRFPILQNNPEYYKIAYIGNAQGKKGQKFSAGDIDAAKHKLNLLANNDRVQIAILIDATQGMQAHYPAVKTALKEFLAKNSAKGLAASVSICIYRDYVDDFPFQVMSEFTRDLKRLNRALEQISVYSTAADSGAKAYPEASFYGIDRTMKELSWKDSGINEKYILLIGDHGNHATDEKGYTGAGIGAELRKQNFSLNAIQVNVASPGQPLYSYNQMFVAQFNEIKENNQGFGELAVVPGVSSSRIRRALDNILVTQTKIQDVVTNARLGKIYPGTFTQKILARYGINPAIFGATQLCEVGYVSKNQTCENSVIKQTTASVLMKKPEVEALKVQMQQLSDAIFYFEPETEAELKQTVFRVVRALTGDEIRPDQEIAEFIEKKSGIPIQTDFLKFTVERFMEEVRDNERYRETFRKYLQLKLVFLEQVTKESKLSFDDSDWDKDDQIYLYRDTKEEKLYFFSLEQPLPKRGLEEVSVAKRRHAWVPLEFIP